ncbi:MAG: hypothetical protein WC955_04195 [Elusimicrobiota bacterium]
MKYNNRISVISILTSLAVLISLSSANAGWYVKKILENSNWQVVNDISLGTLYTGYNYINIGTRNFKYVGFSWNGNNFVSSYSGSMSASVSSLGIWKARNSDSIPRLYCGIGKPGGLYEIVDGNQTLLPPSPYAGNANKIFCGNGHNTTTEYMYSANNGGGLYEYLYDNASSAWTRTDYSRAKPVEGGVHNATCVMTAKARHNDNVERLYGGYDGLVKEYSYEWDQHDDQYDYRDEIVIDYSSTSHDDVVAITTSNVTGSLKLYICRSSSTLYETQYSSTFNRWPTSSSNYTTLSFSGALLTDLKIAQGRSDGINRMYVTSKNGRIYERTYTSGSGWSAISGIYVSDSSLKCLDIGTTRSDNRKRIYCGDNSGRVYEITYDSAPPVSRITSPSSGNAFSTPPVISGTAADTNGIGLKSINYRLTDTTENPDKYWAGSAWVISSYWVTNAIADAPVTYTGSYNTALATLSAGHNYRFETQVLDVGDNYELNFTTITFMFDNASPNTVTDLTATEGQEEQSIKLSWTTPGNDGTISSRSLTNCVYTIKHSTNPNDTWASNYVINITTTATINTPASFIITGLSKGIPHYFWLKTKDELNNYSPVSNTTESYAQDYPPVTPTGLTVLNTGTGQAVSLYWTQNPEPDLLGYNIYRSTYSCGLTDKTFVIALSSNAYVDTGLIFNTTYFYQLSAFDSYNHTSIPNTESIVYTLDTTPPEPILSFQASPGNTYIILSWIEQQDSSIYSHIIERSNTSGDDGFSVITTFLSPGTTHQDTGLVNDTTYWYRTKTVDVNGMASVYSSVVSTFPSAIADISPPAAITSLTADKGINEGSIQLSWATTGDDGTSGNIWNGSIVVRYTSSNSKQWDTCEGKVNISTNMAAGSSQSISITTLSSGVTYYFWIRITDDSGVMSDLSNRATTYAQIDLIPPSAITTLIATQTENEGSIQLEWTYTGDNNYSGDISNGALNLYYSVSSADNEPLNAYKIQFSTSVNSRTTAKLIVTGLTERATYYLALRTRDDSYNWSSLSNTATTWAQADRTPPARIENLAVDLTFSTSVQLSWTPTGDNGYTGTISTGVYQVKYATFNFNPEDPGFGNYTTIQWIAYGITHETSITYDLTGLALRTTYYFAIRLSDKTLNNWSVFSNTVTTKMVDLIPPAKINDFVGIPGVKSGSIMLTWTSPGDDGTVYDLTSGDFIIRYSTNLSQGYSICDYEIVIPTSTVPGDKQTLTLDNLISGKTYRFWISCGDSAGNRITSGLSGQTVQASIVSLTRLNIAISTYTFAGEGLNTDITILDNNNNLVTNFTGNMLFTCEDTQAIIPSTYTFTESDNGSLATSIVFLTAGTHKFRALLEDYPSINAEQTVTVYPKPATKLVIYGIPSLINTGSAFDVTVEARDSFDNIDTAYNRSVWFETNDTSAVLPSTYTFSFTDRGKHVFSSSIIFNTPVKTPGERYLIISDTLSTTGLQEGINVFALSSFRFVLTGTPASVIAGIPVSAEVTIYDPYNSVYSLYRGSIQITSSDLYAQLPATTTLQNGYLKFENKIIFHSAGNQKLRITDTQYTDLTNETSYYISVIPENLHHFQIITPLTANADQVVPLTIYAKDFYNNTIPGFVSKTKLEITSGKISPQTTDDFINGKWEGNSYLELGTNNTVRIKCADDVGHKGESESIDLSASALTTQSMNYPNPFSPDKGGTQIRFHLQKNTRVLVTIFTVSGQIIRQWDIDGLKGSNYITWNGDNQNGSLVSSGGYIVLIEKKYSTGKERQTFKIAVVY